MKQLSPYDLHRRTGRSTRIIDASIQELFKTGITTVRDHHWGLRNERPRLSTNIYESERIFRTFLNRLKNEHGLTPNEGLEIDKGTCTAKWINYEAYIKYKAQQKKSIINKP